MVGGWRKGWPWVCSVQAPSKQERDLWECRVKGALGLHLPSKAVCPNPASLGEFLQLWFEARVADKIGVVPRGEGNGNLLQYSCLENPMGGGAW